MKKILVTNSLIIFSLVNGKAQAPNISWQNSFGGTVDERPYTIKKTRDGGCVAEGYARSNDGDVTGHFGGPTYTDSWVIKLSSSGILQWETSSGSNAHEEGYCVDQTTDGGYIIGSWAATNGGQITGNHGGDSWFCKLDSFGIMVWENCYGGSSSESPASIMQTSDGGYIMASTSCSNDGDVTVHHGLLYAPYWDCWIVKMDSAGQIQWQQTYGGTALDVPTSIKQTFDGGYVVAGFTASTDFDITGNHGSSDAWVLKLNNMGVIQWSKCYGGSSGEQANAIAQTTDGGYIIAGETLSNDGDVTGNHGSYDYWIIKIDSLGAVEWKNCYGGTNDDKAMSVVQNTDGSYTIGGNTFSSNYDVSGNHGGKDYWLIKLDSAGNLLWQKCLGGSFEDANTSMDQTLDEGYVLCGYSQSTNGNVTGHHGLAVKYDYWVVKICEIPVPVISSTASIVCTGDSATLTSTPAYAYLWSTGDTTQSIVVNTSGNYTVKAYNDKGCFVPSLLYHFIVIPDSVSISPNICDSVTYSSNTFYASGIYNLALTNVLGCDSSLTINLTVNYTNSETISPVACNWYGLNSHYYYSSGVYTQTLNNSSGCDSILTINLTVNYLDTSVTQSGNTLSSNDSTATYQWLDCNAGNSVITGETNQVFSPATSGAYSLMISENGCLTDTTICFNILLVKVGEDILNELIKISPNPLTSQTTITFSEEQKNTTIKITDMLGNIIQKSTIRNQQSETIDMSGFAKGIYFARITDEKKNVTNRKIIVQ